MAGLLACAGPFFKSQGAKKKAELVRAESDAPKETCSANREKQNKGAGISKPLLTCCTRHFIIMIIK